MPKETIMNKYFLKYKFSALLAMLSIVSITQNADASAHIIIDQFHILVEKMVGNLNLFLSKKDKRTYREHMKIFNETIERHPLAIRSELKSDLDIEANKIVQKFEKPFFHAKTVLQEYQGKDKKFVGRLVKDLKEALPFEKFFVSLKKELITLQKKAITQNDARLVNIIKRFIKYIDQERSTWKKKNQIELFTALCRRMNQR